MVLDITFGKEEKKIILQYLLLIFWRILDRHWHYFLVSLFSKVIFFFSCIAFYCSLLNRIVGYRETHTVGQQLSREFTHDFFPMCFMCSLMLMLHKDAYNSHSSACFDPNKKKKKEWNSKDIMKMVLTAAQRANRKQKTNAKKKDQINTEKYFSTWITKKRT